MYANSACRVGCTSVKFFHRILNTGFWDDLGVACSEIYVMFNYFACVVFRH